MYLDLSKTAVLLIKEARQQRNEARKERDEAQEIAKKYEDRYFGALVERDEARREVCALENLDWIGSVCRKGEKETAIERGWDCFKEKTP